MTLKRALVLAAVSAVGASLAVAPGAGAELRVGKNYRLTSDKEPFRGKDQVALAVNPRNPRHIVEVHANYLTEDCEFTASFDGGLTWRPQGRFVPPHPAGGENPFQPTCRVSDHLAEQMYQTVAFGEDQNVYAASVTARTTLAGGEQGQSTLLYRSVDGGRTFRPGVIAMPGGADPTAGPTFQLPTVVVDPGAGTGGADRVYVSAREGTAARGAGGDVTVAVSNDGGQTFSSLVDADPAGENVCCPGPQDAPSQPVVGPDGSVTVAWRTFGPSGLLKVARSTDQGQTWGAPVAVTGVTAGGHPASSHTTPLQSSCCSWIRLAVDRRPGNGNLYVVYNQGVPPGPTAPEGGYRGADHFVHADTDVYFQRSLDDGATWSAPKQVNDAAPRPGSLVTQTRHPNVSVAPNGRVDIVWQDRRHWYMREDYCVHTHLPCVEARLGDTYYANSTDGGATFSPDRRISDRHHNNDVGFDYRFGVYWAFGPVAAPIGNNQLLVGWMDSREGNYDNDNQDIYLSKVDLNGRGSDPQERIRRADDVALSVALSRRAYPGGAEGLMAGTFANRNGTRVVIVREGDVAGALAGGVLARANLGPVLLSPSSGLPASVVREIRRLDPLGAYVIGDEKLLSGQVLADLAEAGVPAGETETLRLGTGTDPGNAQLIAQALDRRSQADRDAGTPAFDAAIIANRRSPDAGAAAALAAARRLPVLFVEPDSVPAETAAALSSLAINSTLVIGGERWVSEAVMDELPSSRRVGGANQYATSRAVARESRRRGMPDNIAYVTDGDKRLHGALAGSAVARLGGLLLLDRQNSAKTAQKTVRRFALVEEVDRIIRIEQRAAKRRRR